MYQFFKQLMLRTPMLSHQGYSVANLAAVIVLPLFQKALFLANPAFYKLMAAKNFDAAKLTDREFQTLLKYYNRMCFRATPLGLFAPFSIVEWGNDEQIALNSHALLHAHFDYKASIDLAQELLPGDLLVNNYALNPCIYRVHKEYRFVKTMTPVTGDKLVFAIESLDKNTFATQLLKFCGSVRPSGQAITQFIIKATGCNEDEATEYLQFLVEAQVLRCVANINITGVDYLERLLVSTELNLRQQQLSSALQHLRQTNLGLTELQSITETLKNLSPGAVGDSNLFYSVSERQVVSGGLSINIQSQLIRALQAIQKIVSQQPNSNLREFIKQFKARYDLQRVPLLHAVDPEIGLGYSNISRHMHNLMPEGVWKKTETDGPTQMQWTAVHRLFMQLWCGNAEDKNQAILITDEALQRLDTHSKAKLPPTMAVMFRRCGELLQIESAGGVSALGLIGRFSVFSKDVETLCQEVAQTEQQHNPDVIFAELAQLSNLHVDNINRRRHMYRYEIPINAVSTLPLEKQIALNDLWLSVVNDELIVESERLGKRVIPRHSSAYNVLNNDLGVFRLLADIQAQGLQANFSFSLEVLFPGLPHYPRVQYEDTVLALAVWNLGDDFIKHLKQAKNTTEELSLFAALQARWNFPQHIALSKADQFLVFNLGKDEEIVFLLSCIKQLKTLRLQEYLPDSNPAVNSSIGPLAGQYVALLYHKQQVYQAVALNERGNLYQLKRNHIIGSEWLYLKLYCDQAYADNLLTTKILPTIRRLQKDQNITQWFFIRYTDTGYHIRLRMKLAHGAQSGTVLRLFKDKLFDLVHYRLIKEYVADSYQPELERYGSDIMNAIEEFFFTSSQLVGGYIAATINNKQLFSLYSFALITVDNLVNIFLKDNTEKAAFYEQMAGAFYKEFADDKLLRVELDNTYRKFKKDMVGVFESFNEYRQLSLKKAFTRFLESVATVFRLLSTATTVRKQQVLSDMIHMHVNRTFATQQRQQELLVYYFLAKHTQSLIAKQRGKG